MIFVTICVGSACHLKGTADIVDLFTKEIEKNQLEADILLQGSFCSGKCNRDGVTITVNDKIYTGITKEKFRDFWNDVIVNALKEDNA